MIDSTSLPPGSLLLAFWAGDETTHAEATLALLEAGQAWAIEHLDERFEIPSVEQEQEMVVMSGNAAVAMGAMAAGIEVCSMYPITPATDILHNVVQLPHFNITALQAEDEIAGICTAIGASFAGRLGITTTSGPDLALKTEALGLAVITELPLVVVDVQRAGPSTGMPTKTEQADLLQAQVYLSTLQQRLIEVKNMVRRAGARLAMAETQPELPAGRTKTVTTHEKSLKNPLFRSNL